MNWMKIVTKMKEPGDRSAWFYVTKRKCEKAKINDELFKGKNIGKAIRTLVGVPFEALINSDSGVIRVSKENGVFKVKFVVGYLV